MTGGAALAFEKWFRSRRHAVARNIRDYLAIDTSSPGEAAAEDFVAYLFGSVGFRVERAGDWRLARDHDDWSPHPAGSPENVCWVASDDARPAGPEVIFNCHADVIPPLAGQVQEDGDDDLIYGRGACDAKGNLVMAVEALRFLQEAGIPLGVAPRFHIPSEEEIGGNGTLALTLAELPNRSRIRAAICLEPTDLHTYTGHRGCLTYQAVITGHAVHMGAGETGQDAIRAAALLVLKLNSFSRQLAEEAAASPYYAWTGNPCQANVGKISGGEWTGSVAEVCSLTGDVGVAPWLSLADMERRLAALARPGDLGGCRIAWDFRGGLRNEPYLCADPGLLAGLVERSRSNGERRAWNVSCDARHYQRILGVPTAVFGAGELSSAHSRQECVSLDEIEKGASMLAGWLASLSGGPGALSG